MFTKLSSGIQPVLVAQWTARQTSDLKVAGSSPAVDYFLFVNASLWFAPVLGVHYMRERARETLCPSGQGGGFEHHWAMPARVQIPSASFFCGFDRSQRAW